MPLEWPNGLLSAVGVLMEFRISEFSNAWSRTPNAKTLSWEALSYGLTDALDREPGTDKRALGAWSPASYPHEATRAKANVQAVSCLVLDYDDGTSPDAAVRRWSRWTGLLHTTWSHSPELPKFRVVLPLAEPVAASNWLRAWRWAELYSNREIDRSCKDPSRLYFLPYRPIGNGFRADDFGPEWHPLRIPWEAVSLESPTRHRYRPTWRASDDARGRITDPDQRAAIGQQLGGRLSGDRVTGIECPNCGRRDVWWFLVPDKRMSAGCNHLNSCGWYGSVRSLVNG